MLKLLIGSFVLFRLPPPLLLLNYYYFFCFVLFNFITTAVVAILCMLSLKICDFIPFGKYFDAVAETKMATAAAAAATTTSGKVRLL